MKIICKTTLLAADPPFDGTEIGITIAHDGDSWGIATCTESMDLDSFTVDWGDGTRETFSKLTKATHVYAAAGDYTVRIEDRVRYLGIGTDDTAEPWASVYPGMIRSLKSSATRLNKFTTYAFANAVNLTMLDLRDIPLVRLPTGAFKNCTSLTSLTGLPRLLGTINEQVFAGCAGLSGRIDLPSVTTLQGTSDTSPFKGTSIAEFHFSAANEAAIRASALYKATPTLGVEGAKLFFDIAGS